jgi:beta-lactamase regulating signal transducer with metallopeptidase domain
MSVTGGALALLLLPIKPLIKNRLPQSAQYYLGLVVIAALLVPVSVFVTPPNDGPNVSTVINDNIVTGQELLNRAAVERTGQPYAELSDESKVSIISDVSFVKIRFWDYVFVVIPLVSVFVLFSFLIPYWLLLVRLCRDRKLLGISAPVRVYKSASAATPMLIGVFRPVIVLPDREYLPEQLNAILVHELTHHRRKDIWVKWLSVTAVSLHWFNPFAWLARHEIDRLCELSCDETVVSHLDVSGKQTYGDTLIAVVAERKIPAAVLSTTMSESKQALQERLGAIMRYKKTTRTALFISAALIIAAVLAACALGEGQDEKDNRFFFESGEEQVIATFDALNSSDYADITVEFMETEQHTEFMVSVDNAGTGNEERLIKVGETQIFTVSGYNETTVKARAIGDGDGSSVFEVTQTKSGTGSAAINAVSWKMGVVENNTPHLLSATFDEYSGIETKSVKVKANETLVVDYAIESKDGSIAFSVTNGNEKLFTAASGDSGTKMCITWSTDASDAATT